MNDNLIYSYTNEQAVEDGIKIRLGENLFITTGLAETLLHPTRVLTDLTEDDRRVVLSKVVQSQIMVRAIRSTQYT
jgi:diketogulonate reductase-like aldo/keto reductase